MIYSDIDPLEMYFSLSKLDIWILLSNEIRFNGISYMRYGSLCLAGERRRKMVAKTNYNVLLVNGMV